MLVDNDSSRWDCLHATNTAGRSGDYNAHDNSSTLIRAFITAHHLVVSSSPIHEPLASLQAATLLAAMGLDEPSAGAAVSSQAQPSLLEIQQQQQREIERDRLPPAGAVMAVSDERLVNSLIELRLEPLRASSRLVTSE